MPSLDLYMSSVLLIACVCCSLEEQAKGWVTATVLPKSGNYYMPQQRDLQTGSILILTSQKPPARQVQNWLQRGLAAASSLGQASLQQQDAAHASHSRSPSPMPGEATLSYHDIAAHSASHPAWGRV